MDKELFSVFLFNQTGFSVGNSPDSAERMLTVAQNKIIRVDDIYRLQPYLIDTIRVKGRFIDLQGIDYCVLKNANYDTIGYFVQGINMINTNTAEITLLFDAVGSLAIGISNKYDILSGWAIRRHYTTQEDTLFANTIPEEFQPTLPTTTEFFEIGYTEERTNLIASTIDLSTLDFTIERIEATFQNQQGQDYISYSYKPIVTSATKRTVVTLPENQTVGGLTQTIQSLAIYDGDDLPNTIYNRLNAYGLINVITASYQVPTELLKVSNKNGAFYETISGAGKGLTSNLPYVYGSNILNKKVFALSSSYSLMSIITGEVETFQAWEIYHSTSPTSPQFTLMCDLTPGGKPYCRPNYYRGYKGSKNTSYYKCVSGANWANVPIITDGTNGWVYNQKIEQLNNSITNRSMASLSAKLSADSVNLTMTNSNLLNSLLYQKQELQNESYFNNYNMTIAQGLDFQERPTFWDDISGSISGWFNSLNTPIAPTSGKAKVELDQKTAIQAIKYNETKARQAKQLNQSALAKNRESLYWLAKNRDAQTNYLNVAYASTADIMRLKRQQEMIAFNSSNLSVPPTINFPVSSNLQNFIGNGFIVIQEKLQQGDLERFDNFLTQFGYRVNEKLQKSFFNNRPYYNYLQVGNLKIKAVTGNLPQYMLDYAEMQLMVGVRIWHTYPNNVNREQYNTNR